MTQKMSMYSVESAKWNRIASLDQKRSAVSLTAAGDQTDTDFLAGGMSHSTFHGPCLDVVEIGFIELFVNCESLHARLIRGFFRK